MIALSDNFDLEGRMNTSSTTQATSTIAGAQKETLFTKTVSKSITQDIDIQSNGLIWASLDPIVPLNLQCEQFPWMGLGLLSDHGLPFDTLTMFLAAKQLRSNLTPGRSIIVLLPDCHAESTGISSAVICQRADRMRTELGQIAQLLEIPLDVIRVSDIKYEPEYQDCLKEVDSWLKCETHSKISEYTRLGMADALFMTALGGVKVGWSISANIMTKAGRHHEPQTDLLAQQIDARVSAVYVPHGCRMDPLRPRSAPYLEMYNTSARFMLTGSDAKDIRRKAKAGQNHRKTFMAASKRLEQIINTFEKMVRPLEGTDFIDKAERLVIKLSN